MSRDLKKNLNDPGTTLVHGEIILRKPFLKKLYTEWYKQFSDIIPNLPEGKIVEIGSGGGFIKAVIPTAITTDILDLPIVDEVMSAENMKFNDDSVSGIFMINVLHHIKESDAFFREVNRVLKNGGQLFMIEPANTLWGRFFYKNFHHEVFNPSVKEWKIEGDGPLSDANGAMPWIIFKRDIQKFNQKYPHLELMVRKDHTPIRYLLTGGLSFRSLVPSWSFKFVKWFENLFSFTFGVTGMFQTIIVQKKKY